MCSICLMPCRVIAYGTVFTFCDGDFTSLAFRILLFQNNSTRFVAAWDQLSPNAGIKIDARWSFFHPSFSRITKSEFRGYLVYNNNC